MAPTTSTRMYAGQTADQRHQDSRHKLLSAGLQQFGTIGYARTRIDRICSAAHVSTKTFYKHYLGKEQLFLDVYDSVTAASLTAALSSLQETAGAPMAERIPAAVLSYTRPLIRDVRAARIAFVEVMGVSAAVEARRLQYRETLVKVITQEALPAVQSGEIRDRDFRFATMSLAGALNAAAYDWVLHADREPGERLEAKIAEMSNALLGG